MKKKYLPVARATLRVPHKKSSTNTSRRSMQRKDLTSVQLVMDHLANSATFFGMSDPDTIRMDNSNATSATNHLHQDGTCLFTFSLFTKRKLSDAQLATSCSARDATSPGTSSLIVSWRPNFPLKVQLVIGRTNHKANLINNSNVTSVTKLMHLKKA